MTIIISREPEGVVASDLTETQVLQTSSTSATVVPPEKEAPPPAVQAAAPLPPPSGETPNWQEQDGLLRELWLRNQPPAAIAQALNPLSPCRHDARCAFRVAKTICAGTETRPETDGSSGRRPHGSCKGKSIGTVRSRNDRGSSPDFEPYLFDVSHHVPIHGTS